MVEINDHYRFIEARKLKQLIQQYQREIEPYVQQRVKLSLMFSSCILMPDGTVIKKFPPRIEDIDKEYEKMINMIREKIFLPMIQIINSLQLLVVDLIHWH